MKSLIFVVIALVSGAEKKPEGLETFTTSKTTKQIFKKSGLEAVQRALAKRTEKTNKKLAEDRPDAGNELKNEPVEELEVTGTLDEATQRALGAWQQSEGLPETGLPDYLTLDRLGIKPDEVFHHKPPAAR